MMQSMSPTVVSMPTSMPHFRSLMTMRGGFINAEEVFDKAAVGINIAGGALLVVACISAIGNMLHLRFSNKGSLDQIKFDLGQAITFALELLVAADVIDTLTKSAHSYHIETLYKILLIVVIRTTLAFFLGKEMGELEHKLHKPSSKK